MKKILLNTLILVSLTNTSMATSNLTEKTRSFHEICKIEKAIIKPGQQIMVSKTCEEAGAKPFIQAVMADVPVDGAYNIALAVYALCQRRLD